MSVFEESAAPDGLTRAFQPDPPASNQPLGQIPGLSRTLSDNDPNIMHGGANENGPLAASPYHEAGIGQEPVFYTSDHSRPSSRAAESSESQGSPGRGDRPTKNQQYDGWYGPPRVHSSLESNPGGQRRTRFEDGPSSSNPASRRLFSAVRSEESRREESHARKLREIDQAISRSRREFETRMSHRFQEQERMAERERKKDAILRKPPAGLSVNLALTGIPTETKPDNTARELAHTPGKPSESSPALDIYRIHATEYSVDKDGRQKLRLASSDGLGDGGLKRSSGVQMNWV